MDKEQFLNRSVYETQHPDLGEGELTRIQQQLESNKETVNIINNNLKSYDTLRLQIKEKQQALRVLELLNNLCFAVRDIQNGVYANDGDKSVPQQRHFMRTVGNMLKEAADSPVSDRVKILKKILGDSIMQGITREEFRTPLSELIELDEMRNIWPNGDRFQSMMLEDRPFPPFFNEEKRVLKKQKQDFEQQLDAKIAESPDQEGLYRKKLTEIQQENRKLTDKLDSAGKIELNPS